MDQKVLLPSPGAKKSRKRVGRGNASGHGTYSGRGLKGQKSRSGYNLPRGFEGGQLPLIKRLPRKRGFVNIFKKTYTLVNLGKLNDFDQGEVSPEDMLKAGVIKTLRYPIKVLASGELSKSMIIKAHKYSATAKTKIEAAGGRAEEIINGTKTT